MTAVEVPLLRRQGYVDGQWVDADSGETFAVTNPATGEVLAEVPRMGAAETRRALAAAERALPTWKHASAKERAHVLRRFADLMLEHADFAGIAFSAASGKFPATVRRAVVNQQKLPMLVGLGEHAVNRFREESLRVMKNDDDRDA